MKHSSKKHSKNGQKPIKPKNPRDSKSPEYTQKQYIGRLGENLAARKLSKEGYSIVARNYRKKCGEIDIICQKSGVYYFVEVKSRQLKVFAPAGNIGQNFPLEDNVHNLKLMRLRRAISLFMLERHINAGELRFLLMLVEIVEQGSGLAHHKVTILNNLVL